MDWSWALSNSLVTGVHTSTRRVRLRDIQSALPMK